MTTRFFSFAMLAAAMSTLVVGCSSSGPSQSPGQSAATGSETTVRLGFFPNLTHAPALVGVAPGHFDKDLGPNVQLQTQLFNAGPEIIEALRAKAVDIAYVGPSPVVNLYQKSGGKGIQIISGACSGGASLVARAGAGIVKITDLGGKRVAVPQLGNTQDVSLRSFLLKNGLNTDDKGGTVQVLPIKNGDTLIAFKLKQVDAAWVPEPWATRLIKETGATRVLDERSLWPDGKFTTTVVVVRPDFLKDHPDVVASFVKANDNAVDWINKNPAAAIALVNKQLGALSGKPLPDGVIQESWKRLTFTSDPDLRSIEAQAAAAQAAGYLKEVSSPWASLVLPKPNATSL